MKRFFDIDGMSVVSLNQIAVVAIHGADKGRDAFDCLLREFSRKSRRAGDEFYGQIFEIAGEGPDQDFYHYIDRLKDVINRGGVKIPVGELEAAIQRHPKILEAAAIGYPDARIGERICVVAALMSGAVLTLEELIADLAAASVAKYMLPERLEIVSALPRNAVGKILKRQLTEDLLRKHRA